MVILQKQTCNMEKKMFRIWDRGSFSRGVKMVTDLMEILYNYNHLNNFVSVTGDIDLKDICRIIISEI